MKTIAFYINNSMFLGVDCRRLLDGNPGIGGSEYLILLVSSQLSLRSNELEVVLYVQKCNELLPQGPQYVEVGTCQEAVLAADQANVDVFIIDSKNINWTEIPYRDLKSGMRLIPWCHNAASYALFDLWAKEERIGRIVQVGREMLDLYRDHKAFGKSDYIYNIVPFPEDEIRRARLTTNEKRAHNVVYMGALAPAKSFHVLAEIWPDIIRDVPDAQLYVIGSGRLYRKDVNLGPFGLAEEAYELQFVSYLVEADNTIIPSVHFLGHLGSEKYEYLRMAKVAVPNPTGTSETFCISAVEMQAMGAEVVAMQAPGYYDTFCSNGRIVQHDKNLLRKAIVDMLLSDDSKDSYEDTLCELKQKFAVDTVMRDWETLLGGDLKHSIHPVLPLIHSRYCYKWLKEVFRRINSILPFNLRLRCVDLMIADVYNFRIALFSFFKSRK